MLQGGREIIFVPAKDATCPEPTAQAKMSSGLWFVRIGPLKDMPISWILAVLFLEMAIIVIITKKLVSRNLVYFFI